MDRNSIHFKIVKNSVGNWLVHRHNGEILLLRAMYANCLGCPFEETCQSFMHDDDAVEWLWNTFENAIRKFCTVG